MTRLHSIRTRSIAIVAIALALLVAACNGSSGDTTTTTIDAATTTSTTTDTSGQDLVFAEGEVPETVPDGFPIPDQAVIGSTMIDRTRGVTEMVAVYPANVTEVVDFFETNLPALGYVIDSSSGTDANWTIVFADGDLDGEIVLVVGGSGLTQGTVRIVTPLSG